SCERDAHQRSPQPQSRHRAAPTERGRRALSGRRFGLRTRQSHKPVAALRNRLDVANTAGRVIERRAQLADGEVDGAVADDDPLPNRSDELLDRYYGPVAPGEDDEHIHRTRLDLDAPPIALELIERRSHRP